MDHNKFYTKQVSLSEWLKSLGLNDYSETFQSEDNTKRERLKVVSEYIQIPFDDPIYKCSLEDILTFEDNFQRFFETNSHKLCALRLVSNDINLPKLRIRGLSITEAIQSWLPQQEVALKNAEKYSASIIPHTSTNTFSTIFICNKEGLYGEIIHGGHYQLTQGFIDPGNIIFPFYFDFKNWHFPQNIPIDLKKGAIESVEFIHVENGDTRLALMKEVNSTFSFNYINGYFETAASDEYGIWFIDYNRLLDKGFDGSKLFTPEVINQIGSKTKDVQLKGRVAMHGRGIGRLMLINLDDDLNIIPNEDYIILCDMTSPDYLGLMKSSKFVVTKQGGILSHAAITCRELKIPCVVGVGNTVDNFINEIVIIDTEHQSIKIA